VLCTKKFREEKLVVVLFLGPRVVGIVRRKQEGIFVKCVDQNGEYPLAYLAKRRTHAMPKGKERLMFGR